MTTRDAAVWVAVVGLALALGCGNDGGGMDASSAATAGKGGAGHGGAGTGAGTGAGEGDAAVVGDSGAGDAAASNGGSDAALPGDADAGGLPSGCPAPAPNQPPESLSCTGLYGDITTKKLASGVQAFMPAVPLWSDGAGKLRFIYLPPGQKIDISDPDAWRFPIGTKFWKEFKSGTKRVETRMFWKLTPTFWARTAYQWNDGETEATRTGGGDIQVAGKTYHIPSTTECDQCHKGRPDHALGFEEILLGLPGSTGLNLAALKSQGLLTGGTVPSKIAIGDDGTGFGSDALAFLHVNCGVSCHNGNSASEAYSTGLRLAVKVADADGRAPTNFDSLKTTVNVKTTTGRWLGKIRITPGSPSESWLYSLMSTRNPTNMKDQMPPIASRVVPTAGAKLLSDWITAM